MFWIVGELILIFLVFKVSLKRMQPQEGCSKLSARMASTIGVGVSWGCALRMDTTS